MDFDRPNGQNVRTGLLFVFFVLDHVARRMLRFNHREHIHRPLYSQHIVERLIGTIEKLHPGHARITPAKVRFRNVHGKNVILNP
jgi:hypothetical protein